ncbi:DUF6356 family protein [Loktanella sp. S4079]|uniref:DUF6356 family protein n=1 Tax=Loktanella sp. S4079 TaxID=579483 RepID=UPI0005FA38E3|nr:DUF6356 family protein [Loktanella sp. S4079]KJZ18058.1 capsule biosynthesis protein [Loktanella sp. S4079]
MSQNAQTKRGGTLLGYLFLDHPAKVSETYFQHMRFALGFAFWLSVAGCAALVHAVIPALCETTASRIVLRMSDRINNRHAT